MRYFLQMGHGMMAMNLELLSQFSADKAAGAILWPRTIKRTQVERHVKEIRAAGGAALFDPCFYVPSVERDKIIDYPYWDGLKFDTSDFTGEDGKTFCERVIEYQEKTLQVDIVLLPGRYSNARNEEWLDMHRMFAEVGAEHTLYQPVYSTIAIGPDLIRDQASIDTLANELVAYPVDGFYFIYRPPNDEFLSRDDTFLLNLLQLFLSISLAGKEIIIGYANQQDLLAAAAGVETIASGNFRNVRRFSPDTFEEPTEEDRRRATWFYDGRSLCEFRVQQLGVASKFNLRDKFGPASKHSAGLLAAPNPVTYNWSESDAFRHYLTIHRDQWLSAASVQRSQRAEFVLQLLKSYSAAVNEYRATKFPLGERSSQDNLPVFTSTLEAFIALESERLALL